MKEKPNVYFRADGNSEIGLGHIFRLLSISEIVSDLFSCHFIINQPSESLKQTILQSCKSLIPIPANVSLIDEPDWISNLFNSKFNIVVLDGYHFDSKYQKALKSTNVGLICIDDISSFHFYADAIINHAPGISSSDYSTEKYTKFYGGLDYTILRSQFLTVAKKKRKATKITKLFICFGGSDFNNLTTKILNLLVPGLPTQINEISVVIGSANVNRNDIVETIKGFKNVNVSLLSNLSSDEMVNEMLSSQMAILPSSTILYEAIAVKMPIISGYYVDNQENVYHGFNDLGLIYGVGNINEFQDYPQLIQKILNDDIQEVLDKQSKYITGTSSKAIRKIFLTLSNLCKIRPVSISDMELFFRWANNPEVRKNAMSSDQIKLEDHVDWFKKKVNSSESHIYILMFDKTPIGQIRFDFVEGEAVIDYSIDHEYRGKGFGKILLELGILQLQKDYNGILNIKAVVKKSNVSSNIVFEKMGFTYEETFEKDNELYNTFKLIKFV